MEILMTVVGKVAEYAVVPIVRQGGYLIQCKSNLLTLQARVDELKATRGRMQNDIVAAERRGDTIQPDVVLWMTECDKITGKAEELLKHDQAKMKCLHGFCPNLKTRHKLSRKSTKLLVEVVEMNGKGVFPSISYGGRTEEVFLSTTDYEAFDSRISTVTRIIDELKNLDRKDKIGVYGIGGVGKTTLAEEVVRQVIKDGLFEDVVMVRDVKENPNIGRLQKEIAEKLGMSASENLSIAENARRICGRIKNKKTLVVLDDIWNFFDLKLVGLPDMATCKILLTSRSREICIEMGVRKEFQLGVLGEEESWSLFESKAGDGVKDPDIQTVAAEVAKRCGGLPVLIVTVASSLRNTTLVEWKDALRRLQTFGKSGSTKQAFLALEWSYDRLDDEELKPLFLLCGVIAWKNSIFLDDLFKLAMGLDLLKSVVTVEDARNSLLSLVQKLKGFSLLLDHDDEEFVRMHDLVHDVANDIACRNGQLLSVACGAQFKNWPKNSKCSKISINSESLAELSDVLEYKKLEMFYLRCEVESEDEDQPLQVPNSFFANMEKLKVLGLRNVKINFTSLKFLKNLQALCVEDCEVEDIALVGELRKLEILSLVHSSIEQLPEEIGELSRLRMLDLTGCNSLKVIAPNVLSRLTSLEELRMINSTIGWEAEDEGERSNASLSELKHLSLLTALEIYIRNPDMLPKDLFSEKLERFQIRIGSRYKGSFYVDERFMNERSMNSLILEFTTGDKLDDCLKMLVKRSADLSLIGGDNVDEIAYQLVEGEAFRKVKHLYLGKLDSTYIINSKVVFSSLTTLEVVYCHGMKFLLSYSVARSLDRLRALQICDCKSMEVIVSVQDDDEENNMDNMFSKLESLMLRGLPSLVRLYSRSYAESSSLEEILNLDADNVVHHFLFDKKTICPSLETLDLNDLPKLKAVWQNQLAPDSFSRLRDVTVRECTGLINLFVPCISDRLDALESLLVALCPSLQVVFKYGGLKLKETHLDASTKELKTFICFPNLRYFLMDNCDKLKYIFQTEDRPERVPKFVFPKLKLLLFSNLPHLKSIHPGKHVSQWPSLKKLEVDECGQLEMVAGELSVCQEKQELESHSIQIKQPLILCEKGSPVFPNLKDQTLRSIEMWSGPVPPAQFCTKLKLVSFEHATFSKHATFLEGLNNLKTIIVTDNPGNDDRGIEIFVDQGNTSGPLGILPQVRKLKIRYMYSLMHIGKESSQSAAVPVFPKLETLSVKKCPVLKNLDTSAISFQNLTVLTVSSLDGLEYLVTHQIATSLMQLTKLKIGGCKRMEVIVATEEDDHEIAFCRLKYLKLNYLPRLRGLSSASCNLKFPSLQTLAISRRLKLKLFDQDEMRCTINYDTADTDTDEDASADDDDNESAC